MKVALATDWFHPRIGGIELQLQDLAARLARDGHEVVVITPTPGPATVNGVRVVRVEAPLAPVFGFLATPGGLHAVADAIGAEKPDVVHAHVSIVSPAAFGAAAAADRSDIPLVVTFHSIVPQTQAIAHIAGRALGVRHWRARFTAVSGRVARDVQPIAPTQSIRVLPNGLDTAFWKVPQSASDGPKETIRLVSVMRLNAKKRPLALIDLFREVEARRPSGTRIELTLVGDGPLRGRVERAVSRFRLSDRVFVVGRKTRDDIRSLFAGCDVFVLPTVRESFGLAALEARCAGLPVVAMRASGVAELVEDGVNGLLASSDRELAGCVLRLVRDPTLRCALSATNRSSVPRHDWSNVLGEHLEVYCEAVALRNV